MLPLDKPSRVTRRAGIRVACLAALVTSAGCGAPADTGFSMERGAKHVRMLATAFGSRPTGSEANGRARNYIVAELRQAGFEVRLQEALATTGSGLSTPVVNIIAVRPGRQAESVALVSHYDSPPESRGAADAGLGVAVCVEAGRVLAARADPRYTLLVALTDGEELGLMGARALREAPEFARVRAFLNFEAVGTNGPPRLFQAGPGNCLADRRMGGLGAASVRVVAVHRDLPPAPERHGLLGARAGRAARPELRADRQHVRLSHQAGHARAPGIGHASADGRHGGQRRAEARRRRDQPAIDRRRGRTSMSPGGWRSRTRAARRASSPRSCSCWA